MKKLTKNQKSVIASLEGKQNIEWALKSNTVNGFGRTMEWGWVNQNNFRSYDDRTIESLVTSGDIREAKDGSTKYLILIDR